SRTSPTYSLKPHDTATSMLDGRFGVLGVKRRSINIVCRFYSSSSTKFFCRNDCRQILLRTTGDEAESGRYSIRYYQEPIIRSFTVKTTISKLKLNDSGLYSCGLGESWTSASFLKFNILVTAGEFQRVSTKTQKIIFKW
uniref:Immunoglobulin subtype domain-containing protein n=1 Tax=Amphiprion percula TaxID=161767 RepID=A0A3P8U7X9_AMPPE